MSETELCQECIKRVKHLFPVSYGQVCQISHCHHEPKEKEKCFCEFENTVKDLKQLVLGQWQYTKVLCPVCGRKL